MTGINPGHQSQLLRVTRILQQHMELYNYEYLELPLIEPAQLFLTRAGSQLIEQLVEFKYYGHHLALRPEFTASAAAHYVRHVLEREAVRWQFEGPTFRDNPADSSQDYQNNSQGAELIGIPQPYADAEIISMAAEGVEKLGINNIEIVCGHVGLQQHLLAQFGLDSRTIRLLLSFRHELDNSDMSAVELVEKIQSLLSNSYDDRSVLMTSDTADTQQMLGVLLESARHSRTMGGRTRAEIAQRILEKKQRKLEKDQLLQSVLFMQNWRNIPEDISSAFDALSQMIDTQDKVGQQLLYDWRKILEIVQMYGISSHRITIQPDLARDWEYYTGFVFGLRVQDSFIASGGRYDELIAHIGEKDKVPAVGFAYYMDQLLQFLPDSLMTDKAIKLEIVANEHDYETAIRWSSALRRRNIQVAIVLDLGKSGDSQTFTLQGEKLVSDKKLYELDKLDDLINELKVTST